MSEGNKSARLTHELIVERPMFITQLIAERPMFSTCAGRRHEHIERATKYDAQTATLGPLAGGSSSQDRFVKE